MRRHAPIFRWCRAGRLAEALAGLVAVTAVLLATAPGRASAVSTVAIPFHPQATVRLEGAGWGHGVGMSQWGARGRAHAGQSAAHILQAYYPGTEVALADTGGTQIRVLIDRGFRPPAVDGSRGSSNGLPGDIIGVGGSWQVEGVTGPLPAGARLQMLEQTGSGGITVGVINPSGVWTQGFQLPSVLVIKPLEATTRLRAVHKPAGKSEPVPGAYLDTYRGSLVLHDRGEAQVDTVNVLPIEDYLRGVVPAEMPHHWPAAALQAQAIAARGYALTGLRPSHSMWDIDDTPNHQAYAGSNHERESTNAAVDATAGQVLTYGGEHVRPYYFSTSNGHTEASSDQFGGAPLPYLLGVSDLDPSGRPWDADSPFGTWRTESFGLTVLGDALRAAAAGVTLGDITSLEIRRTDGGRTVRIQVNGTAGSANVSHRDFRAAFNQHAAPRVGAIAGSHFRIVLGHSLTQPVVPLNLPNNQSRYYEETGHNIIFGFLRYFDANGGVETFGLPLTEEFQLGGRNVQYFEKARFEYHAEHAGTRYEVQLGLLGDELTAARRPFPRAEPIPREPNHRYFPETRQAVHYAFLAYWESQGGLDRFGYPISDEMPENGRTVQYFQRARFEWYPEFGEVRLGSIGSELLRQRGLLP
ncbi:MAG: SpoIID/LytB domain-containing protein [Chloroflexota bacterium]|nr:SpoIID/LytB domain-containing protein [Chloroflexota bacterium]